MIGEGLGNEALACFIRELKMVAKNDLCNREMAEFSKKTA